MQLDKFLIAKGRPLREALELIEANKHGIIFVTEHDGSVVGLATDGDIRRRLLDNGTLSDAVETCMNVDFVWQTPDTPRELLLKKLDHRIRVVPLLDSNRKLINLVTSTHLPAQAEGAVYARARAPVRISFAGGGSDVTHYFAGNSADKGGAVINSTISLYSHATLRLRPDSKILIHSTDLAETLSANSLSEALANQGNFGLVLALIKAVDPDFGFEMYLNSDFPLKSGLGGSAVVSAAILGCFNEFRRDRWNLYELSEIAYQAERHYLGVAGGWQDQYAAVFGGFNFMEFRMDQNVVHPLRLNPDMVLELEESLVLCDTGIAHDSGNIHQDQHRKMATPHIRGLVDDNVSLCYAMRNDLLRGRLADFGKLLDQGWKQKQQFSDKISNAALNGIYDGARENGAVGGKILGAGGGGFFLFFASPFRKHELVQYLQHRGLKIRPFRFEPQGLQSWMVRENAIDQKSSI